MPDANEQIIRRSYELMNAGDLEKGKELIHTDCEIRTRFTSLSGRTYRGLTGVDEWAAEVDDSWETIEQTPERFVPIDGERTAVIVRFRGRGRGSGVEIDETLVVVWTVRNGKVAGVESYEDLDEALNRGDSAE
jgi:ketosteroid isomerase-like protein